MKKIRKGCTVILDNASFHSKKNLRKIAEEKGIRIVFLPPYSPDLNRIEKSWANMKRWLQDNASRFNYIESAIEAYFADVKFLS